MAYNTFVTNDTLQKQIYEEKAWKEKLTESFWHRFSEFPVLGSSEHIQTGKKVTTLESRQDRPVIIKRDLMKQQGDKINYSLIMALRGDGIVGSSGQTLSDNLEAMSAYKDSVELEEYAHGVGDKNPLGRKKVMFVVTDSMKEQLTGWGIEKFDKLCFSAIEDSPSTILYAGDATSTATLTSADKVTMSLLRKAKTIAKSRNDGARFMIEPFMYKGKKFYFAVCGEDVFYDLKEDSEYKESLQNAYNRGDFYDHPIFAGAEIITADGIVLFSSERAGQVTNWGSGGDLAGGKITLFGNKSLLVGMGAAPTMEVEYEDLNRKIKYGYMMIAKVKKPVFNSLDYGSMQIRVARSQVTDA